MAKIGRYYLISLGTILLISPAIAFLYALTPKTPGTDIGGFGGAIILASTLVLAVLGLPILILSLLARKHPKVTSFIYIPLVLLFLVSVFGFGSWLTLLMIVTIGFAVFSVEKMKRDNLQQ